MVRSMWQFLFPLAFGSSEQLEGVGWGRAGGAGTTAPSSVSVLTRATGKRTLLYTCLYICVDLEVAIA